jgi:hypothetical protein
MTNRPIMLKCNWWFVLAIVVVPAMLLVSACAKPVSEGNETTIPPTSDTAGKPNQPPAITKLSSEVTRLRTWDTTTIKCIAEDPDGDQLRCVWSATGGKIQAQGSTVGWTAPGIKGEYTVTVRVLDGKGGEATSSITFDVFCCGN